MGGELVTWPASQPPTYGEQFREIFPYYLAIGMTERQYWDGDCELVRYYRKAEKLRAEKRNQEMWIQGMYIYEAIGDVSPLLHAFAKKGTKAIPYRTEPYQIGTQQQENHNTEQEKENERLKAALFFRNWARATEKKFK